MLQFVFEIQKREVLPSFSPLVMNVLQDWKYTLSKNTSSVQAGLVLLFSVPLKTVEVCLQVQGAMCPHVMFFFCVCV